MFIKVTGKFIYIISMLASSQLLWIAGMSIASAQEYDVEVVIFEDISGRYARSENWPIVPEESSAQVGLKSGKPLSASQDKRIRLISEENYKLGEAIKKMTESNEYRILLHSAWRQTGLDRETAFPVHIASQALPGNKDESYVEGNLTFVMSRYLHLIGELTFYKADIEAYTPYPVSFSRRMRSREVHYIDHPMIGVMVMATPVGR